MTTPWDEARKRYRGRRGQTKHAASEAEGAKGGALQINSGRHWTSKRDYKKFDFLFENRQTDGKTITVNGTELGKITREAMFEQTLPAMRLDFTALLEDWTLIRTRDFEEMHETILLLQGQLDERRRRNVET